MEILVPSTPPSYQVQRKANTRSLVYIRRRLALLNQNRRVFIGRVKNRTLRKWRCKHRLHTDSESCVSSDGTIHDHAPLYEEKEVIHDVIQEVIRGIDVQAKLKTDVVLDGPPDIKPKHTFEVHYIEDVESKAPVYTPTPSPISSLSYPPTSSPAPSYPLPPLSTSTPYPRALKYKSQLNQFLREKPSLISTISTQAFIESEYYSYANYRLVPNEKYTCRDFEPLYHELASSSTLCFKMRSGIIYLKAIVIIILLIRTIWVLFGR